MEEMCGAGYAGRAVEPPCPLWVRGALQISRCWPTPMFLPCGVIVTELPLAFWLIGSTFQGKFPLTK